MAVYVPLRPRWNPRGVVVNYVSGGQLCVRSWPKGYRDARTESQQRQRGRMARVCEVLPFVKGLIGEGYSPLVKRNGRHVGAYHCAVSTALREWFIASPGGEAMRLERMRLTDGVRALPEGLEVRRAHDALLVSWNSGLRWAQPRLLLAAREPAANAWVSLLVPVGENVTRVAVRLPPEWAAKAVEVWVAFVGDARRAKSLTRYCMLSPVAVPQLPLPPAGREMLRVAGCPPLARKGRAARVKLTPRAMPPSAACSCRFGLHGFFCLLRE